MDTELAGRSISVDCSLQLAGRQASFLLTAVSLALFFFFWGLDQNKFLREFKTFGTNI